MSSTTWQGDQCSFSTPLTILPDESCALSIVPADEGRRVLKSKSVLSNHLRKSRQERPGRRSNSSEAVAVVAAEEVRGPDFTARVAQVCLPVLTQVWHFLRVVAERSMQGLAQVNARRSAKRLMVRETVSLGDKRFVAIVQVDEKQFLLGGSQNSVSVLAELEENSFAHALKQQSETDRNMA